jgi:7-cyano-7-deazaguanine synthase
MVANGANAAQPAAVLFSAGLDSAVLLAAAARDAEAHPIYVRAGLAWEPEEQRAAARVLAALRNARIRDAVTLSVDMRDVYSPEHWAVRGVAPDYDTPDSDVYIEGRNVVLLSKAAVYMARAGLRRLLIGPLAGNPFPDATPQFFRAMSDALSLGLGSPVAIEAPLVDLHKSDVIRMGVELGVPLELTLSCMQPVDHKHCGQCSKCRERRDAFYEAGVRDPTEYAVAPKR